MSQRHRRLACIVVLLAFSVLPPEGQAFDLMGVGFEDLHGPGEGEAEILDLEGRHADEVIASWSASGRSGEGALRPRPDRFHALWEALPGLDGLDEISLGRLALWVSSDPDHRLAILVKGMRCLDAPVADGQSFLRLTQGVRGEVSRRLAHRNMREMVHGVQDLRSILDAAGPVRGNGFPESEEQERLALLDAGVEELEAKGTALETRDLVLLIRAFRWRSYRLEAARRHVGRLRDLDERRLGELCNQIWETAPGRLDVERFYGATAPGSLAERERRPLHEFYRQVSAAF